MVLVSPGASNSSVGAGSGGGTGGESGTVPVPGRKVVSGQTFASLCWLAIHSLRAIAKTVDSAHFYLCVRIFATEPCNWGLIFSVLPG